MDNVIVGMVLALIGLAVQPPVNGIAFSGGPHFSHYGEERTLGMTATVAATTSWGLELGVAYARRGYDDTNCVRGTRISPPESGMNMDIGGGPPCFGDVQHFHRRVDYIDAKLLWRHEFPVGDRVTPNLLFGGLAGFASNCRNEPLDSHPVGDCLTDGDDVIIGLVAGGGAQVHIARRLDVTLDFQFGHELDITQEEYAHGREGYRTFSLIAGLAYRR